MNKASEVTVSEEDVERACIAAHGESEWFHTDERTRKAMRGDMRAALESFALQADRQRVGGVVMISDNFRTRLEEIDEWERTGVLRDGELRKMAYASSNVNVPSAILNAKLDTWREASQILLAQCGQVREGCDG